MLCKTKEEEFSTARKQELGAEINPLCRVDAAIAVIPRTPSGPAPRAVPTNPRRGPPACWSRILERLPALSDEEDTEGVYFTVFFLSRNHTLEV